MKTEDENIIDLVPSHGLQMWVSDTGRIVIANYPDFGQGEGDRVVLTTLEARVLLDNLQNAIDLAESKEDQE